MKKVETDQLFYPVDEERTKTEREILKNLNAMHKRLCKKAAPESAAILVALGKEIISLTEEGREPRINFTSCQSCNGRQNPPNNL